MLDSAAARPIVSRSPREEITPQSRLDVLVVEDDAVDRLLVERHLLETEAERPLIRFVKSITDAREAMADRYPDLVLLDMGLPDSTGLDSVHAMVTLAPDRPVVVLSGDGDEERAVEALSIGATDYLVKTALTLDGLRRSIRHAIERKRTEFRLSEQADLLNRTDEAIVVCSMDGRIRYRNDGARKIFGPGLGDPGRDAFALLNLDPETRESALAELREKRRWTGDVTTADGRVISSRWTISDGRGSRSEIVMVNSDVTAERLAEKRLRHAQRMDGVGMLACGIAHDFNNLLAPLLIGIDLIENRRETPDDIAKQLGMMRASVLRGKGLVNQLLTFGRGVDGPRQRVEMRNVVDEIARVVRKTLPPNVRLELDLPDSLSCVTGQHDLLAQALLNLAVNARDALSKGGRLRLAAADRTLANGDPLPLHGRPGEFVCVEIADEGVGIDQELHHRIFEPFFTTKDRGQGTGLGLSTALGIVKSHQGFIHLDSKPGRGSRFQVFLPRNHRGVPKPDRAIPEPNKGDLAGKRILLADDDTEIVWPIKNLLQSLGVEATGVANGREALEHLEWAAQPFDLVISDIDMPEMGGEEMLARLRERDAQLPVLFITGMNVTAEVEARFRQQGAAGVLLKPFDCKDFLTAIHAALTPPKAG